MPLEVLREVTGLAAADVRGARVCPYCGARTEMVRSAVIYGAKAPDYGPMWTCGNRPRCRAWVGCHPSTDVPLGRLADGNLRQLKQLVHEHLDPLWKVAGDTSSKRSRNQRRGEVYRWLAERMGMDRNLCHVGYFSPAECRTAATICREEGARRAAEDIARRCGP